MEILGSSFLLCVFQLVALSLPHCLVSSWTLHHHGGGTSSKEHHHQNRRGGGGGGTCLDSLGGKWGSSTASNALVKVFLWGARIGEGGSTRSLVALTISCSAGGNSNTGWSTVESFAAWALASTCTRARGRATSTSTTSGISVTVWSKLGIINPLLSTD